MADLIVASGSEQLRSHRREISALFCDLRKFAGSTEAQTRKHDGLAGGPSHRRTRHQIQQDLERYAGDGVMVVFNDPVPVGTSVGAGRSRLKSWFIEALTETWRRLGHDIGFGIGIALGFATLGTIGFEGRFDYAAIGTGFQCCLSAVRRSQAGSILISPRVLMKVENAVKNEPVGEFELKGSAASGGLQCARRNFVSTLSFQTHSASLDNKMRVSCPPG